MKIDKYKVELAMANAKLNPSTMKFSRTTYYQAIKGKELRPATVGKLADALGVNVRDIIDIRY